MKSKQAFLNRSYLPKSFLQYFFMVTFILPLGVLQWESQSEEDNRQKTSETQVNLKQLNQFDRRGGNQNLPFLYIWYFILKTFLVFLLRYQA